MSSSIKQVKCLESIPLVTCLCSCKWKSKSLSLKTKKSSERWLEHWECLNQQFDGFWEEKKKKHTRELSNTTRPGCPWKTTVLDHRRILSMVKKNTKPARWRTSGHVSKNASPRPLVLFYHHIWCCHSWSTCMKVFLKPTLSSRPPHISFTKTSSQHLVI